MNPISTTDSASALHVRGAARAGLGLLFFLVFALVIAYAIHFRGAAATRAVTAVCHRLSTEQEVTVCTVLNIGVEIIAQVVFIVSALVLYLRKPDEVMAVAGAIMLLGLSMATSAVTLGLALDPAMQPLVRVVGGVNLLLASTHLVVFPDGRFQPRWTLLLPIAYLLFFLSWWVIPIFDISELAGTSPLIFPVMALLIAPAGVVAFIRYRTVMNARQQQQSKWVVLGAISTISLLLVFGLIGVLANLLLDGTMLGIWLSIAAMTLRSLALTIVPITIMLAIIRYRLWDVDLVIGRAGAITLATTLLIVVFVGATLLVQRVASMLLGGEQAALALSAASVAVALLFNPVRERVRAAIDARFYPQFIPARPPEKATAIVPPPPPGRTGTLTGHEFAGFSVIELIGRGGMAEVYRARQTGLNRDVAIKTLSPGLGDEGQFRARFEREGRTLASLNHPNIVRVYAAGEHNGVFYIAMEFIEGESLAQRLARTPIIPLAEALPILSGVAAALDHAHAKGVVHRDVKPHNIMLEPLGDATGGVRPILMDFGIARLLSSHTLLTAGQGALGTLDYIAPEQIIDTARVDHRADIYALGIVAWQMLTGRLPFNEPNAGAIMMSHLQKLPPNPLTINPALPVHTGLALLRALAKDPDDRFDHAGAFVEALT
jgi:serine/threonine-protein kinase